MKYNHTGRAMGREKRRFGGWYLMGVQLNEAGLRAANKHYNEHHSPASHFLSDREESTDHPPASAPGPSSSVLPERKKRAAAVLEALEDQKEAAEKRVRMVEDEFNRAVERMRAEMEGEKTEALKVKAATERVADEFRKQMNDAGEL